MLLVAREPEEVRAWFVAFHVKKYEWWGERFIPGRFGHVSAFAFLPRARSWVLFSFSPVTGPTVAVFPLEADDELGMPRGLALWTRHTGILKVKVRRNRDWTPKAGLFCVAGVKMLIGSKSRALLPGAHRADGAGAERAAEGGLFLP